MVSTYQYKQDIRQAADEAIAMIIGTLADEDLWLIVKKNFQGKDSLKPNEKVWEVIQLFSSHLNQVLQKYGYPPRKGLMELSYHETEILDISQFPKPDQLRLFCLKYWYYISKYSQVVLEIRKMRKQIEEQTLKDIWKAAQ